jgi:SAM-dependent methyltransferase
MSDRERRRKEGLARLFDQVASTYDHVGPRFFSHFGRRPVEVTQIPTGAVVLDVATGRGAILFPAAEQVGPQGHAVGIDLSARMVRETVCRNQELWFEVVTPLSVVDPPKSYRDALADVTGTFRASFQPFHGAWKLLGRFSNQQH